MKHPDRTGRRVAVLGVPALIVAVLTLVALWRVGAPGGESGATGTMGINSDRHATLDNVVVRELTSERTFWISASNDDDPTFVVWDRPVSLAPGARVSIVGRVEPAPAPEIARREWRIDESTAMAVRERGVYVRALEIRPQEP